MVVHLMSTFIYFHLHVHNEKTKMTKLSDNIQIIKFSTKIQRIIKKNQRLLIAHVCLGEQDVHKI